MSFEEYKIFRAFPSSASGRNKSVVIVDVNSKRIAGSPGQPTIGLSREYVASDGRIKKQNDRSGKSMTPTQRTEGKRLVRFIAGRPCR